MRDVAAYHDFLAVCPPERERLIDAILINVTAFFRDESSWSFLAEKVVPELLTRRDGCARIRVWSAGCSTGEEAYTLAIVFAEAMGMADFTQRVMVHATDVDDDALKRGRRARYKEAQVSHLPERLVHKYFRRADRDYVIRDEVRRRVCFHRHDIIGDAALVHVDLLACRNMLMYLNADTQLRILRRFHRALNDGGILFLGRAETLLTHEIPFMPIDLKRRISAKLASA